MQTTRSRKELEQQLKKQGIDVVFRQNDSGRIYGVTFIDHDSRVVLNGSPLGARSIRANVFNERFRAKPERCTSPKWKYRSKTNPCIRNKPEFTPKSDIVSGVASVLGAFGGLLSGGASGGDEPQDTARQKRKKKAAHKAHRLTKNITIMQQEDDLRGLARVMDFMRAVSILFVE